MTLARNIIALENAFIVELAVTDKNLQLQIAMFYPLVSRHPSNIATSILENAKESMQRLSNVSLAILVAAITSCNTSSKSILSELSLVVTPTFTAQVQVIPAGPQHVALGGTQSFTVIPASGYVLSTTVGGTCAAGSWNGHVYTTGAIDLDCGLNFAATLSHVVVTPVNGNTLTTPADAQAVPWGSAQAFSVSAETGYALSQNVTGTCPAGDWNGAIYETGPINSNCTAIFNADVPMVHVTSSGGNVTVASSFSASVVLGTTASFTVTANAGFVLSNTVGGTCPVGTWVGNVYTTGAVDVDCTTVFDAHVPMVNVSLSGGNVAVSPMLGRVIVQGTTASFTVLANAGFTLSSIVGGTCTPGTWAGSTYTTGTANANCTVVFDGTLIVPTITNPAIHTQQMVRNGNATTFSFAWQAPTDTGTTAIEQNYTLCASSVNPAHGSFSTASAVLNGNVCAHSVGVTSTSITVPVAGAYFFNVVVQNLGGAQLAYRPKGEYTDPSMLNYFSFEGNANDMAGSLNLTAASYQGTTTTSGQMTTDRYGDANSARSFSGTAHDCLMTTGNIDASVLGTNSRTITFWLAPGTNPSTAAALLIGGNGSPLAQKSEFGLIYKPNYGLLEWYFGDYYGAGMYQDNSGWKFYALEYGNGSSVNASVFTGSGSGGGNLSGVNTAVAPMFVGCGVDGSVGAVGTLTNYFDGAIDDIRIFNRRLCDQLAAPCSNFGFSELSSLYEISRP